MNGTNPISIIMNIDYRQLEQHAQNIRRNVIKMAVRAKSAHLGGVLSIVEILTVLYFQILKIDPQAAHDPDRDRLIFSKGHAGLALYAALVERGFAAEEILETFYKDDTMLTAHPTKDCMPGVETTTGSLGHGLPLGTGLAWAAKHDNQPFRTFVLMSDGECDGGSTWESILFAGHHQMDNLIAVVDYNKIQGFGRTAEVLNLEPFVKKWESFNWAVQEVDGHDLAKLQEVLSQVPFQTGKPSVVIAHTIKGKGTSLEDTLDSHYKIPPEYATDLH